MSMAGRAADSASSFTTTWTHFNPPYVILKWRIENFSGAQHVLKSPCFDVSRSSKWNLVLDPHVEVGQEVFVKIYLRRNPKCSGHSRTLLNGELSVHGPGNELLHDRTFDEVYDAASNSFAEFLIPKVFFSQSLVKCCGMDNFLIRCEMILSYERNVPKEWKPHLEKLSSDFRKLIGDGKFTDVSIVAKDDIINAHKAILHSRSPVLLDILKVSANHITEDNEKAVHLSAVLFFVYTGNPDFLFSSISVEMFGKVAQIARRWELHELENILTPVKMHCVTRFKSEDFLFTWQIKNFSHLDESSLHSSEFITNDQTDARWKLILEKSPEENVGLYLMKVTPDSLSHKIGVEFKVYNSRSGTTIIRNREYLFGPRISDQKYGYSTLCGRSFLQTEIIKDDVLNVDCRMKFNLASESWILFTATSIDVSDEDPYSFKYLKTLSRNLRDLFESKKLSDLKICTKDEIYNVHRAILWARSPYFADVLTSRSAEYISVPIDSSTLKEVLVYIYSAELPEMTLLSAQKLYEASFLLKLQELHVECRLYILQNITIANVLEIMVMAHKHGDKELELAAETFASNPANAKMIINTIRWVTFRRMYNAFAIRIYHNLAWAYCNSF